MTDLYRFRHRGIISGETLNIAIALVGCGSIGSYAALLLGKIGFRNVSLFDFDEVSIENVGCQLFGPADIGRKKVDALKDTLNLQCGELPWQYFPTKLLRPTRAEITILAVDSMRARKQIFELQNNSAIIDCRIGAEEGMLFVSTSEDRDDYSKSLYSDDSVPPLPCTAKNTAYIAAVSGGLMVAAVKALAVGLPVPKLTQFDLKYMRFM